MTTAFEILVTTLLTIVIGLSTWSLKTQLRQDRELTQINQQLWGKDGRNGHASDLRRIKGALDEIGHAFTDLSHRLQRVEERVGIDTPVAHRKFRGIHDDDSEGDR